MENQDTINKVEKVKETNAEYCRRYYKQNKEKHLAYVKERIECPMCKKQIARHDIQRHGRTKRHLLYKQLYEMENNKPPTQV